MPRQKSGAYRKRKIKRILKRAKGFRAGRSKLNRAGLLVINPPYGFEASMREAASLVAPRLGGTITSAWVAGTE